MNRMLFPLVLSVVCFLVYLSNTIIGSISFYVDPSFKVFLSDVVECLFLIAAATFFVVSILQYERAEEDN